jgi:hypothetical protein
MRILGVITATIIFMFVAKPARADWLDDCVAHWQGRSITISGTIDFTKNRGSAWEIFLNPFDYAHEPTMPGGHCPVDAVYVKGTRPSSCADGRAFTASGTIDGKPIAVGLVLDASSVTCR